MDRKKKMDEVRGQLRDKLFQMQTVQASGTVEEYEAEFLDLMDENTELMRQLTNLRDEEISDFMEQRDFREAQADWMVLAHDGPLRRVIETIPAQPYIGETGRGSSCFEWKFSVTGPEGAVGLHIMTTEWWVEKEVKARALSAMIRPLIEIYTHAAQSRPTAHTYPNCPYLDGQRCYTDESFKTEIYYLLVEKGQAAMWEALEATYRDEFENDED